MKKMNANEILNEIDENGGWDDFNHWTATQIAEYIHNNYECSRATALQVGRALAEPPTVF